MRTLDARRLVLVVLMATLGPAAAAWGQERQNEVLVLYPTRRDAQIVIEGDRQLPRILEDALPDGLDYYSEFIDQGRFATPGYDAAFRDFLTLKYHGRPFDLVIAMGDVPLQFLEKHREAVFGAVPVVYFASHPLPRRISNSTGLTVLVNLADTLDLATALQPDVKNVFVVSGARASNGEFEDVARAQLQPFESRFTVTYLSGLPTEELEKRL